MAENGNACMTCAYLSPTPGFFAPFYYCQCLCPYSQRCSDTKDGCLNEGWSLHTMYICIFCAWLNPAKVCCSVLVWNTCTRCIFLRRLHRSKYEQLIRQMDYWWSLKERALKTYTVFLHASCTSEINICKRLNYIFKHSALNPPLVSGSAPPLINHGWRTAELQWDPSNGPTFTFDGMSFSTNFKMGHVEKPLNWNIWKFSLSSDFFQE